MKAIIRFRDDHSFLAAITAAWIKQNWSHALASDVTLEKEFRSPKGYLFHVDVYG